MVLLGTRVDFVVSLLDCCVACVLLFAGLGYLLLCVEFGNWIWGGGLCGVFVCVVVLMLFEGY